MIKFLKKFKDKILIALACSFIGIGTILSNTLETKAYNTNQFTYTIDSYYSSSNRLYFTYDLDIDLSSELKNDYVLLVNFNANYNNFGNSTTTFYLVNYFTGNESSMSVNYYLIRSNPSTMYFRLTYSGNFLSNDFFLWNSNFDLIANNVILNIDLVKYNEITITPYTDLYINNLESQLDSLQSQYDTLQAEYTSYQNTHAYTNEQYNSLMTQNATLTQQVQSLQSQYDNYVSLHSYTNTQYETLLNNYNNLQTMYNNLQQQYLDLQQRYNELNLLLSPFIDNIWIRSATLNGATIDISSTSYHNNVVSFNGTYLEIYPSDMDIYSSYIQGKNDFQMIASSSSTITIGNYTAIAPLSHSLDDGFSIDFYLDNNIVFSSNWFDNDMTSSDGSSSTDTFSSVVPITFNRFILHLEASTGSGGFTSYSYFKATTGSFNDGYNYAVEQLQPRINDLENGLEQAINQQQVKYSEGYNAGFDARIIHNLYMV